MLSRHPSVAVPPTCLAAPGRTRACSRFQSMKEAVAVVILRHTVSCRPCSLLDTCSPNSVKVCIRFGARCRCDKECASAAKQPAVRAVSSARMTILPRATNCSGSSRGLPLTTTVATSTRSGQQAMVAAAAPQRMHGTAMARVEGTVEPGGGAGATLTETLKAHRPSTESPGITCRHWS